MRALISIVIFLTACSAAAQDAPDDSEIMEAYAAYSAAVESGDNSKARRFAKEAYELAEARWGDGRKETAILATNYADQLSNTKAWRRAISKYERCVEVLQRYDDTLQQRIYCMAGGAYAHRGKDDVEKARDIYLEILTLILPLAETEKWAAVDAGEAYLALAMLPEQLVTESPMPRGNIYSGQSSTRIRPEEKIPEYDPSGKALASNAIYYLGLGHDKPTRELAQAHRIAGNYAEADEDYAAAEAHYLAAYEILKSVLGENHADTLTMQGRVALMRVETMERPVRREPIREPSSDRCSVVVRGELEIEVCRDKRYPPYFPNQALFKDQQGFVLVRFDIAKEGRTTNARVILSWPGGIFDERTLDAVKKWTYFPPTDQYGKNVPVSDIEAKVTFQIGG